MVCNPQIGLYACVFVLYVCTVCIYACQNEKVDDVRQEGGLESARLDRSDRHLDCTRAAVAFDKTLTLWLRAVPDQPQLLYSY
jgi:hypothetical protein